MIEIETGDNFATAIVRHNDDTIALNFPKAGDIIQLGFSNLTMFPTVNTRRQIPISNYIANQYADNTTHIEEATQYLEQKEYDKLEAFMLDFYKSIVDHVSGKN